MAALTGGHLLAGFRQPCSCRPATIRCSSAPPHCLRCQGPEASLRTGIAGPSARAAFAPAGRRSTTSSSSSSSSPHAVRSSSARRRERLPVVCASPSSAGGERSADGGVEGQGQQQQQWGEPAYAADSGSAAPAAAAPPPPTAPTPSAGFHGSFLSDAVAVLRQLRKPSAGQVLRHATIVLAVVVGLTLVVSMIDSVLQRAIPWVQSLPELGRFLRPVPC